MALQFIMGGSGSGKTTFLYQQIIRSSREHPRQVHFLLVPEQFTMQAQKDVILMHPEHGTMNIDILSFQRLAYRIFEELAVENLQVLDDMGKSMVLRKVAANERRRLIAFQGHLSQAGFISQLKSMLSEFYQYGITPQILQEMVPQARSALLKQKLQDFAVVFEGFQNYIQGHYITTEEVLDVLCRVLPRSEMIRSSVIALDGFTGFTPVQYRLLELMMVYAKQVTVTVTADESDSLYRHMGMQNLFYMSHQVACRLSQLAEKNQIRKLEDVWMSQTCPGRFSQAPELAWLERSLFRYGRGRYEGEMTGVLELYQASTPSREIGCIVHRIQQLVRQEQVRYREIAVITGDLAGYGKEIVHQFEQNGIPYFLDDKKNVLDNPMVELIRSALEAVRKDFSYESVFRFLRTGLVADNQAMTDRMENYVLAMGIRGHKRWQESWERTYRGAAALNLTELNEFRNQALAPLFQMREDFCQEKITISGMAQAVVKLLEDCRIEEKLQQLGQSFQEQGEYRLAREYGQVYERVTELLQRLSDLLGEEQVGRKEFMEILDAGFAEISVGVIPATVDRVVVGDITRTRLAHVKVLFFAGVNDGVLPMKKDGGTLLSDREREFFQQQNLELAPTAREDNFRQRFYLYLMMTKPSHRLIISYATVASDGKSRWPAYLVGELRKMYPALECIQEDAGFSREIFSAAEAKQQLIAGLRHFRDEDWDSENPQETKRQFLELYRWFLQSEQYQKDVKMLVDGAFYAYEKQGIGRAAARALYGTVIQGSVSRLEQYAACAYAHFLKYGLELMERPRYELAVSDMGNLFHDSIDLCFRRVKDEGKDWRQITDQERISLVRDCVGQITSEYGNTILGSSSRNAYLARRIESITQRTVWALQQQICKGDFQPAGFEVFFSAADNLDALKISLSEDEAVHLRGRVDRLDLYQDEKQVYVKIIDYKSGSTSFDLVALYYGLQLQLVVYMDAVMEMTKRRYPEKEVIPAGILYYNIANPLPGKESIPVGKDGQPDQEAIDQEILRQLRMNGLINSELEVIRHMDRTIEKESDIIPVVLKDGEVQAQKSSVANRERFEILRKFVHEKVKCAGMEILHGEIGAEPYKSGTRTACDFCPYHAVCGFDKKTAGYEFRRLKSKKTEEIWEELCQ